MANVHPSPIPSHRRALANHLQAPRQWTPSAPLPPARPLAVRADTRRYSDSPFDVGGRVGAAVAIGSIVKLESMFLGGLEGKAETGVIDYGPCSQDSNPSLFPFPFPFPPWSRERETASTMSHARPSLGPQLPLHNPCGPTMTSVYGPSTETD